MSYKVITISREFGSGGRTVGRDLAKRLGYAFYDKELVERIAEESGYSKEFIESRGEHASSKSSFFFNLSRSGGGAYDGVPGVSDKLYIIQHNLIKKLAEEGPCVIVGRCADYVLKDNPEAFHAFIYADTAFKADRIVRLYGESADAPEKRLEDKDVTRRVYYKNYTGRTWGLSKNYDISLRSSAIGISNCVDIIAGIINSSNV